MVAVTNKSWLLTRFRLLCQNCDLTAKILVFRIAVVHGMTEGGRLREAVAQGGVKQTDAKLFRKSSVGKAVIGI